MAEIEKERYNYLDQPRFIMLNEKFKSMELELHYIKMNWQKPHFNHQIVVNFEDDAMDLRESLKFDDIKKKDGYKTVNNDLDKLLEDAVYPTHLFGDYRDSYATRSHVVKAVLLAADLYGCCDFTVLQDPSSSSTLFKAMVFRYKKLIKSLHDEDSYIEHLDSDESGILDDIHRIGLTLEGIGNSFYKRYKNISYKKDNVSYKKHQILDTLELLN